MSRASPARRILVLALLAATPLFADLHHVANTADSGAGSLRDRIAAAAAGGDEIQFQIPLPATIAVATPLLIEKSLTNTGPGADQLTLSGGGGQPPNRAGVGEPLIQRRGIGTLNRSPRPHRSTRKLPSERGPCRLELRRKHRLSAQALAVPALVE